MGLLYRLELDLYENCALASVENLIELQVKCPLPKIECREFRIAKTSLSSRHFGLLQERKLAFWLPPLHQVIGSALACLWGSATICERRRSEAQRPGWTHFIVTDQREPHPEGDHKSISFRDWLGSRSWSFGRPTAEVLEERRMSGATF